MEIAVASYRRSFFPVEQAAQHGVTIATARAGNVIGGGDWSVDRIVPDAIRALESGRDLVVRNPHALRPWQHVLEPLAGYLWLGARLYGADGAKYASGWNFGPSPLEQFTVADLADAVTRAWGSARWLNGSDPAAPHEAGMLTLAIDKARPHLGWRPLWEFATTVERTVDAYRALIAAVTPGMVSAVLDRDIARYESDGSAAALTWSR